MIHGQTVTGHAAKLTVTEVGFDFEGSAQDTILIDEMRKERCIYAGKGTREKRAFGIQCNCEVQGFNKTHIHNNEQYGAIPEEVPIYTREPDTG